MPELFYDFHIHSCLSPCGDDESTPVNIAMLAKMLGLDTAALTDHNSCKNCPAFFEAAKAAELIPIAGMELTTQEEIHVLCLFPALDNAMEFDKYVHERIMPIKNKPEIYGNQLVKNTEDETVAIEDICLINATDIDFYSVKPLVKSYGGIMIPAHIDRKAFSLINTLGDVPPDAGFDCVEIKYPEAVENLTVKYPYIGDCRVIFDSDAHMLENISLPNNKIEVDTADAKGILSALSKI